MAVEGKVILVTGGTGSFGQEYTRQALILGAKVVRIFSRDWHRQVDMRQKFNNDQRLRWLIGDVRDRDRLRLAMRNCDIVVHAAAIKDVPTCEYNPAEAIKTNVLGSRNVIEVALEIGIPKVLYISTDKAVYPINHYGKTKGCAESDFIASNIYRPDVSFSCVRYGNVMGSSGSIVPLWLKQKENGILYITDTRMTRFFLTIEQGVSFVMGCLNAMQGGEIFVPRVPSVSILGLAEAIAPEAKVTITGSRPGEKLHETLITREEMWRVREFEHGFVILPHLKGGALTGEKKEYCSKDNDQWLTKEDLSRMLHI